MNEQGNGKIVTLDIDLQTRKLHFIESILAVKNEKVIEKLEVLLKKEQQKEGTKRVGIEQYNSELEEANGRIESGEYTPRDDVKKESATWLK